MGKFNKEKAALKYAIERILTYSELDDWGGNKDYIAGKKVAYIEVIGSIQNALKTMELSLEEYDLDFDVDNMY